MSTAAHQNADAMSRLPLSESPQVTPLSLEMILLMEELNTFPVTAERISMDKSDSSVLVYVSLCRVPGHSWYRMYSSSHV